MWYRFDRQLFEICLSGKLKGTCSYAPLINVLAKYYSKKELEVLVHECIHASNPNLSEKVVQRMGREIGRALWGVGYRRKRKLKKGKL